jgi:hypothetical protein
MKLFYTPRMSLAFLLFLALNIACSRSVPPPTPLTEQELPGVLEKAFTTVKQPEAKELVTQVLASFQAKDYSKAFWAIQTLGAVQNLTKEQANVTARATLTINALLQSAQASGDAKAAATLKQYHDTK